MAIGYVRGSTEKQADFGVSLEAQSEKVRAMSVVQGAELAEVIIDAGESTKSLSRPGMARLLSLVDAGAVDVVIIAKLDRRILGECGRVPGHGHCGGPAGAQHHDGGITVGARSHRRADARRHAPQAGERVGTSSVVDRLECEADFDEVLKVRGRLPI